MDFMQLFRRFFCKIHLYVIGPAYMAEDGRFSFFICGSNLHGQVKQISGTTDDGDLYCTTAKPMLFRGENFSFSWSQIWSVRDNKVSCYGFNGDIMQKSLQKYVEHTNQVVPLQQSSLIETTNGIYQVSECGSVVKVLCEQSDVTLLGGTNQTVIGMNGNGQLCESTLNTPDGKLDFTLNDCVFGKHVLRVACGHEHVLMLSTDGEVYSHGSGSRGQLGHGEMTVDEVKSPRPITSLEGLHISSIAAGGWHSVALTDDGDLYVWGWNEKGQLGLPSPNTNKCVDGKGSRSRRNAESSHRHVADHCFAVELSSKQIEGGSLETSLPLELHQDMEPVLIQTQPYGLDMLDTVRVKKTACGSRHTCVLLDSNVLMTCGWNSYGQLGHGERTDCDYLCAVCSVSGKQLRVVDVHAGAWNTVIVTDPAVT